MGENVVVVVNAFRLDSLQRPILSVLASIGLLSLPPSAYSHPGDDIMITLRDAQHVHKAPWTTSNYGILNVIFVCMYPTNSRGSQTLLRGKHYIAGGWFVWIISESVMGRRPTALARNAVCSFHLGVAVNELHTMRISRDGTKFIHNSPSAPAARTRHLCVSTLPIIPKHSVLYRAVKNPISV